MNPGSWQVFFFPIPWRYREIPYTYRAILWTYRGIPCVLQLPWRYRDIPWPFHVMVFRSHGTFVRYRSTSFPRYVFTVLFGFQCTLCIYFALYLIQIYFIFNLTFRKRNYLQVLLPHCNEIFMYWFVTEYKSQLYFTWSQHTKHSLKTKSSQNLSRFKCIFNKIHVIPRMT